MTVNKTHYCYVYALPCQSPLNQYLLSQALFWALGDTLVTKTSLRLPEVSEGQLLFPLDDHTRRPC